MDISPDLVYNIHSLLEKESTMTRFAVCMMCMSMCCMGMVCHAKTGHRSSAALAA